MKIKTFMCVFFVVSALKLCIGEDSDDNDEDKIPDNELYRPKGMSRDAWVRCRGMPCDQWERIQLKRLTLKKLRNKGRDDDNDDLEHLDTDYNNPEKMSDIAIQNGEVEDDEIPSEAMLDEDLKQFRNKTRRYKRNFFQSYLRHGNIFKSPVFYKFDGTLNPTQKGFVYAAVKRLSEQTCYQFKEKQHSGPTHQEPIIFSTSGSGCWAVVGYQKRNVVNLNPVCFKTGKGVPIHEILHALGMLHEQQRPDRDKYLQLYQGGMHHYKSQFLTKPLNTDVLFDLNSILLYSAFIAHGRAMAAKGNYGLLYDNNMGQRYDLSFYNAKSVNLQLCPAVCKGKPPLGGKCQRNGYQDPLDCSRCRCPPGFAGRFCEEIASGENMRCGGSITVSREKPYLIKFPEDGSLSYPSGVKCYWYVKSANTAQLRIRFFNLFMIGLKQSGKCMYDFVEVIYQKGLHRAGPRYCGKRLINNPYVTTESPELLLVFQSAEHIHSIYRKGFRAYVIAVGAARKVSPTTPLVQTTTPRLTTEVTTTPAKTTRWEPDDWMIRIMKKLENMKTSTRRVPTTHMPTTRRVHTTKVPTTRRVQTIQGLTTRWVPSSWQRRLMEKLRKRRKSTTIRTTTRPTTRSMSTSHFSFQRFTSIGMKNGKFHYLFKCSFEVGNHRPEDCGIRQMKDDEAEWVPGTGHAAGRKTGPPNAVDGSHYLYVDSRHTRQGDKARLELPTTPREGAFCIYLWYFMYGRDVGNLKVLFRDPVVPKWLVSWRRHGGQYTGWHQQQIMAVVSKGTRFMIQAEMGLGNHGDIAIDKVTIKMCN